MVWGCISAHGIRDLYICEGTIDAEAYVGILERHAVCLWKQLFPGTQCVFQQDNAMPNSAWVSTANFVGIECVCLTSLPVVQIYLLLKMYGASWRGESDNGNHGLLSSSSLVYTKNGQKFHLQNCNNWYLQVPNLQLPSGKHASVPTYFECVAGIHF